MNADNIMPVMDIEPQQRAVISNDGRVFVDFAELIRLVTNGMANAETIASILQQPGWRDRLAGGNQVLSYLEESHSQLLTAHLEESFNAE